MKTKLFILLAVFFLASCRSAGGGKDGPHEAASPTPLPVPVPVTLPSLPDGYRWDCSALVEDTVFLFGAGENGTVFLCIDTVRAESKEVSPPAVGPVVSLNGSSRGTCIAIVLSARPDSEGTLRELFTLFEIDVKGEICRKTELAGIRRINLLALGTPVINDCALLETGILVIVNNRVILLDLDGELLDHVVWDSPHPRIAACTGRGVCLYDTDGDAITLKTVDVIEENTLSVTTAGLSSSFTAVIPTNTGTVYAVEEKTVFSVDVQTGKKTAAWEFPYGFDPEKDWCCSGASMLLQARRRQVGLYRIA